jgi:cytochrome bd-type quinol oxidase subunit 2
LAATRSRRRVKFHTKRHWAQKKLGRAISEVLLLYKVIFMAANVEGFPVKTEFVPLVYLALGAVVLVVVLGAWVILKTPESVDFEARKLRFAAATFTGITMLFVFVSVLYFAGGESQDSPGRQIFDKGFTAMFTLAGTIVGYLFGSTKASATTPIARSPERRDSADSGSLNQCLAADKV